MSSPTFASYPGFGAHGEATSHYSQAVVVPPGRTIHVSGQGGWTPEPPFTIPKEWGPQVDQAFANVDLALRTAGGKGWAQVYKLRIYVAPFGTGAAEEIVRNLRKWGGEGQKPVMTVVGVEKLAFDMGIEIEAEAYLDDGLK